MSSIPVLYLLLLFRTQYRSTVTLAFREIGDGKILLRSIVGVLLIFKKEDMPIK